MAIKSTRQDSGNAGNDYPKLMQSTKNHIVVLFEYASAGVIVTGVGESCDVGYRSDGWDMDNFTDFHGSITLENDKGG